MGWFAHPLRNRWQTLVSWGLTHEFLWWSLYRLIRVWQGSSTIMESSQSNERQLIYIDQASLTSAFAKPEKWACVKPQVWLALRHTDVCWQIRWMFALVRLGIIIIQVGAKIRQLLQNRMCCHLIIIMLQKWRLEGFNFPFSCVKPLFGSCSQETQTFRTPEPSNSYLSLTSGGSVTFYNTYNIWKRGNDHYSGNCAYVSS